jgi:predicted PurR-regulated permease PerM
VLKAALIALCIYLAIVVSEVLLTIGMAVVFALGLDRWSGGSRDDLKDEPLFQQLDENTDGVSKAESVARDAAKAIPSAATALLGITGALVGSVLSVVLVFLTLFLLTRLPGFKTSALALLPPRDAAPGDHLLGRGALLGSSGRFWRCGRVRQGGAG